MYTKKIYPLVYYCHFSSPLPLMPLLALRHVAAVSMHKFLLKTGKKKNIVKHFETARCPSSGQLMTVGDTHNSLGAKCPFLFPLRQKFPPCICWRQIEQQGLLPNYLQRPRTALLIHSDDASGRHFLRSLTSSANVTTPLSLSVSPPTLIHAPL